MHPRHRRLQADYERLAQAFGDHAHIRLAAAEGQPPERYVLDLQVRSLVPAGESAVPGDAHRVEIFLPLDYPRRPPFCRMLSPVFHPNIDPQKICIGDHWSAGQTLEQLVRRIAEMLAYQSYNTKSPLNARAAAWAEANAARLPLDPTDFSAPPGP